MGFEPRAKGWKAQMDPLNCGVRVGMSMALNKMMNNPTVEMTAHELRAFLIWANPGLSFSFIFVLFSFQHPLYKLEKV